MKEKDTAGNFEVTDSEVMTRREVLVMGAMAAAGSLVVPGPAAAAAQTPQGAVAQAAVYVAKDFSPLAQKKMDGLSQSQIEQHLKLYNGYVGKANEISAKLKDVELKSANATYSPVRELLVEQSYAVNGVVYHELYFGNLGGKGGEPQGDIRAAIEERFGSVARFNDFLKAAGKSARGWVIIGFNTRAGYVDAFALDLHNMWVPANMVPLLVLDVYEHAYMVDYGIDRGIYLDAFMRNLDWEVIARRFSFTRKHPVGLESTV